MRNQGFYLQLLRSVPKMHGHPVIPEIAACPNSFRRSAQSVVFNALVPALEAQRLFRCESSHGFTASRALFDAVASSDSNGAPVGISIPAGRLADLDDSQTRHIVSGLHQVNTSIFWSDLLLTTALGWISFCAAVILRPFSWGCLQEWPWPRYRYIAHFVSCTK
jgi:hypothetical protein